MCSDIDYKDQGWRIQITWQRTFDMWICFQILEGLPQTTKKTCMTLIQHPLWLPSSKCVGSASASPFCDSIPRTSVTTWRQRRIPFSLSHAVPPCRRRSCQSDQWSPGSATKMTSSGGLNHWGSRTHSILHTLQSYLHWYLICMIRNDGY